MRDVAGKGQKGNLKNLISLPSLKRRSSEDYRTKERRNFETEGIGNSETEKEQKRDNGSEKKENEVLKLMRYMPEKELQNYSASPSPETLKILNQGQEEEILSKQGGGSLQNKEEVILSIRKQLASLKDRSQRIKFFVEEMISVHPPSEEEE